MSLFMKKYEPKNFDDLIYADPGMRIRFQAYIEGLSFGHILLHGPYGCGKTTIAKMLPGAIIPSIDPDDIMFIQAAKDGSVERIRDLADGFMRIVSQNSKNQLFLILDEVDQMSDVAETVLRNALDAHASNVMVILTSNDLSKIDPGVRDRCDVFSFPHGSFEAYLPLAERVVREEGINLPEEELHELVKSHTGSIRQLLRALEAVVVGIRLKQCAA